MPPAIVNLAYLIAAVCFILAFKGLAHPRTAVRGNLTGAFGMLLAIVVTLLDKHILGYTAIFAGILVGGSIGALVATRVKMTSMPEMVALLNGFGGGASVLVAGGALVVPDSVSDAPRLQMAIATVTSGLIGAVTFFGSLVAFTKLADFKWAKDVRFPGQQVVNSVLFLAALLAAAQVVRDPSVLAWYWVVVGIAALLGVLLVIPIGGANMPIVICLLNSYSGLAAAATSRCPKWSSARRRRGAAPAPTRSTGARSSRPAPTRWRCSSTVPGGWSSCPGTAWPCPRPSTRSGTSPTSSRARAPTSSTASTPWPDACPGT